MDVMWFSVFVLPALVVGVMAVVIFVMMVRRHWLVGALALASALCEIALALPWMDVLPYGIASLISSLFYPLCLLGPLALFFAGWMLMRSCEVKRRKFLLALSFGGFALATAHAVFLLWFTLVVLPQLP